MADPAVHVPRQFTSNRVVRKGDFAMAELTAAFRDYGGQLLRSFTVGAPASPLYRELHRVAEAALHGITGILRPGVTMQEIVDAAAVIEEAGFTTCDDLVHGYGGGYLPPVLGSKSRPAGPLPDMKLEKNMMLVVQPNVVTRDERAGVQTGELFLITANGCESLHRFPRGLQELA
jgi:Xaa-Pro aminopeptidase